MDSLFGLPEVATLMRGVDQKARPDAVTDACIDRRRHLYLVNSAAAATAQGGKNPLLTFKKSIEDRLHVVACCRLEMRRSPGTDAGGWFQDPGEKAAPEIGAIGPVEFRLAGTRSGDDLLPDGKVSIGAEVEVLKALGG